MTNKPTISRQKAIDICKDLLHKGIGERQEVLARIGKDWRITVRTFDRYWKKAQEQYLIERSAIEAEKMNTISEKEKEALKDGIISKLELLKILSDIANGKKSEELNSPSYNDRMKAIDIIAKVQGYFAPEKHEYTGDGINVKATINTLDDWYNANRSNKKNDSPQ